MDLTTFLAQLLGIYFLIMAADLLFRKHEIEGAIKDFASSKGLLVFSGSSSLLFGLAIILAHPVYEGWAILITLLGYLMIIRGGVRIAFPSKVQKKLHYCFHEGYWVIFLVILVLGVYLTYKGFNTTYYSY